MSWTKSSVANDPLRVETSYNRPGMYAVIKSGGKQTKVSEGMTVSVELLGQSVGEEVEFTPVMVVDGETVHVGSDDLASAKVLGVIKDEIKGTKVIGFRYKSKANERKRFGHRQRYHQVEITGITLFEEPKKAKPRTTRAKVAKPDLADNALVDAGQAESVQAEVQSVRTEISEIAE